MFEDKRLPRESFARTIFTVAASTALIEPAQVSVLAFEVGTLAQFIFDRRLL
jgi:hypothetical protein